MVLVVQNPLSNAGDIRDTGSIPGSGRSPGGGNGHPLSSILGWRIPWTEDPGGLRSTGSQRVGNQWLSRQQEWYETSCYVFSNYLCLLFRARLFNSQLFKLGYLSFLFWLPHSMQDLRSPTRDPPAVEGRSLKHWIARDFLGYWHFACWTNPPLTFLLVQ